jgi:rubrerythrin
MTSYPAGKLLKLALGFEHQAEKLYRSWARKFAKQPDAAAFWIEYAEDEVTHARLLKELQGHLSRQQRATPVECDQVEPVTKKMHTARKAKIADLEMAFKLADDLEHSEINPLFMLITTFFESDPQVKAELRLLLTKHANKLVDRFPQRYSTPELRSQVKV